MEENRNEELEVLVDETENFESEGFEEEKKSRINKGLASLIVGAAAAATVVVVAGVRRHKRKKAEDVILDEEESEEPEEEIFDKDEPIDFEAEKSREEK